MFGLQSLPQTFRSNQGLLCSVGGVLAVTFRVSTQDHDKKAILIDRKCFTIRKIFSIFSDSRQLENVAHVLDGNVVVCDRDTKLVQDA